MNRVSFSQQIKKILLNKSKIDKIQVMNRNKLSKIWSLRMEYGNKRRIYRELFTNVLIICILCFKFKFQPFTLF